MIKQAVISAGGFGTRLKPLTDTMPKPMVPVLGKPTLEWSMRNFMQHGVNEFFLTLHYLPDVVKEHFGDGSQLGVKIHYFIEEQPLGEAGALKRFESQLDPLFYFIYGDMLTLMNYTKMAAAYAEKKDALGMERVAKTDSYAHADVAELDAEGRFVAMHVKPHAATYPNAYRARGSFILDKRALAYIPANTQFTLNKQLVPALIAAGGNFYAYESPSGDYSKAFDDKEKLAEVEAYLTKNNISFASAFHAETDR